MHGYLTHELQVLELRQKITSQAQTEMSKEQREYLLRQQLRAIQEELGEKNPEKAEVEELRHRLAEADLPDDVRKEAERELDRLERLPAAAPDFQVTRTYLELVLELPWRKSHRRRHRPGRTPGRCSTRTISTWRRSRSASSSTWPC